MNYLKILSILFIFFLMSCSSKWETEPVNKFLSERKIDTTKYYTFDQLISKGEISKITTLNCNENAHIFEVLVSENEFVYIEKRHSSELNKSICLKINKNGKIIDSIIISRSSIIINDYIFDKNSYCSWFIDSNKKFKPLKNINYFSKSDTITLKSLINKINKNDLKFYITSEYNYESKIDTCNYILLFKNNQIEKHNFLKSFYLKKQLITRDAVREGFSPKIKELSSINTNKLFKYDNFYAFSYDKQIREGINGSDFFNNAGSSRSYCNSYNGTYFITLENKLKLKLMNEQICENKNKDEFPEEVYGKGYEVEKYEYNGQASVYTEPFLNFYLIHMDVYHYYIAKK